MVDQPSPLVLPCLFWLNLVLSVAYLFEVQLVVFYCSGISEVFLDNLGSPGVTIRCFRRVFVSESSQSLFVICLLLCSFIDGLGKLHTDQMF